MSNFGDPKNLKTRQEAFPEAIDEAKFATDSLYYAAQLLVFCSHGSAGKVAELADQIVLEVKRLMEEKKN
jgi:hypothetical protein